MRRLTFRPKSWALGAYLAFITILMPLLAIRRVLGTGEPGELRNVLLPGFLALIVLAFGITKVLKPRTWLQLLLGVGFIQAMVVGLLHSNHTEDFRNFLSHLFQLGSAYLMVGVGWLSMGKFERKYWRNWTVLSLLAIGASTVLTVSALGRGEVGRLYTPAYGLILVLAYAGLYWKRGVLLAYLLAIVSNKRAVILAMVFQTVYGWIRETLGRKGVKYIVITAAKALCVLALLSGMALMVVNWAQSTGGEENAVARAVNITVDRLRPLFDLSESGVDIDYVSAGRVDEIESAVASANWLDWVFGGGAGWRVDLGDGRVVHNIHVSPLSLALAFGTPFSLLLYASLAFVVLRSTRLAERERDPTLLMAPLYLSGAVIHSLFAYSLFIDILVFFFAGAGLRAIAVSRNGR